MDENIGSPGREDERVLCSVLTPVLNEEAHIVESVRAMQRQDADGLLEFLLVDGASSDRTRQLIEDLARTDSRIRLLDNPSGRTPQALNIALRHARGDYVARMDAHTEYPDDYLSRAIARLREGGTRWVSGPQVPVGRNPVSRAVAVALASRLGRGGSRKWGAGEPNRAAEYDLDSGVFGGVWEREVVNRYGGWDEGWPRNQDSEMAGRFLAAGERLVCLPLMGASYTPRGSVRSLWRQYLQYGEYRTKTAVRHPATLRRSHLLPPGLVLSAGAAVIAPRGFARAARAALAVYTAALAAACAGAVRSTEGSADAALVPVVLITMHAGHGVGMLRGLARHGVPVAALLRVIGLPAAAARHQPPPQPTYAPSLR
jgi:succinoglycan biosynthesis protein ExoA